ncbi:Hypothetical_protein [Hexamita inflata]|uniref:Hypothetical_protein n=1 Tax=Hexamita inflata TaxID=28002 RepID=A0AA86NGN8_9EUKA|nr:Hypothetical protein HINF_LOCUS6862 [Hexamita inflata]
MNILSRISTGSSIRNLFVNMLISSSSNGNISLIGSLNGVLNIRNYQVAGTYYSKQCMSLCVLNSNQAQISITNVNFNPNIYTLGNQSSYLFVQISTSTVQIQQLVLSVGSLSVNSLQTTSTSTSSNQFQYGGVISQISSSSVIIHNTAVQAYLKQTTNFLNSSGMIIGTTSSSLISINNLCVFEQTTFVDSVVNQSGLFGIIGGKISFINVNINYSASGNSYFSNFGTIGLLTIDCSNGQFTNLQITFASVQKSSYDDSEINVAALIGQCVAQQIILNNSNFKGNLSAASNVAIISGYQNSNFSIFNIYISTSNVNSLPQYTCGLSGGIFGIINSIPSYTANIYSGLKIIILIQSNVKNNNSYSSSVIGYSSNIDILNISNCLIVDTISKSISINTGLSYASGIISFSQTSTIIIEKTLISNISIDSQSQTARGIAAGYIAQNDLSYLIFNNIETVSCNISAVARSPMSSGILGKLFQSNFVIKISKIIRTQIYGSDMNNIGANIDDIRLSSGVISFTNVSQVSISNVDLEFLNITMISYQKAATAGIIGWLICSNSTQIQNTVFNITQTCNSQNNWAHLGGVNAIIDQSQDNQQDNIVKYIVQQNTNQTNICSFVGGINGYVQGAISTLTNIQVKYITALLYSQQSSYCGGIIGILRLYNQTALSQILILGGSVINTNLSVISGIDGVIGSVYGTITDNVNITIDSLLIKTSIINITAKSVWAGVFAGTQYSSSSLSNIKISNSQIYSVQIYYRNQTNVFINFIMRQQLQSQANGLMYISSTKSLGFSSVNGIPVSNCENVQVQLINGNNFISENGCI